MNNNHGGAFATMEDSKAKQAEAKGNYKDNYFKIHEYLNGINSSFLLLKQNNYDTKDLEILFNILRYESFSEQNVKIMTENGTFDDCSRKIKSFQELLQGLTSELIRSGIKLEREEKINAKLHEEYNQQKQKNRDYFKEEKKTLVLSFLSMILWFTPFVKGTQKIYQDVFKSPKVYEQVIDSEGNITVETSYTHNNRLIDDLRKGDDVIEEFTPIDETGFRNRRYYQILDLNVTSVEELNEIDLSNYEYFYQERVDSNDFKNIPSGKYIKFYNRTIDETDRNIPNENLNNAILDSVVFEIVLLLVILGLRVIVISTRMVFDETADLYGLFSSIEVLSQLAINKQELKERLNDIKDSDEYKAKYENIVNTICKRIDKTTADYMEILAAKKRFQEQIIVDQANEIIKKEKEILEEEKVKKEENLKRMIDAITTLSEGLKKSIDSDQSKISKLFHTIGIEEDILFETDGDHLKIRNMYIPVLKLLDLHLIDFKNIDVRGIDFRESNAIINPQTVYNKDVSNAKFDDNNIPDWADWTGVNRTKAIINEPEGTMVGIDKSIVDKKEEEVISVQKKGNRL